MNIELTAYWDDSCASSTIKISPKLWGHIKQGVEYSKRTWGYYEGQRFSVLWTFTNGLFSIYADHGMQCVVDESVNQLIID